MSILMLLATTLIRPRPTLVGPKPVMIGPTAPATIAPPARQVWDEKRWTRRDEPGREIYTGEYTVFDRQRRAWRRFNGRVIHDNRRIATYIEDPPAEVRHHPHGACLQLVEGRWFYLHWSQAPKNVDDAVLYMERMLDESFSLKGGSR